MGKGKKSLLDYFRVSEEEDDDFDEDTDDLFDEEDEDEGFSLGSFGRKKKEKRAAAAEQPVSQPAPRPQYTQPTPTTSAYRPTTAFQPSQPSYTAAPTAASGRSSSSKRYKSEDSRLVSFDNQKRSNYKSSSEVYVIRPQAFDDAQTVSDFLKAGKTIVINMEGVQLDPAQRIIDFIGGACYGLGGDLRAISSNIFIAAPSNIEVSGDLRDEILNDSTLSPQLGKY